MNDDFDKYSDGIMSKLEILTFKSYRLDEYIRRRVHDLFWAGYTEDEAFKIIARSVGYTV